MAHGKCKNICIRLKTYSIHNGHVNFPRCSECNLKINTDKNRCPCCNTLLSYKKVIR